MAKLVSRTYGDALFELAVEENRVDELSRRNSGADRDPGTEQRL